MHRGVSLAFAQEFLTVVCSHSNPVVPTTVTSDHLSWDETRRDHHRRVAFHQAPRDATSIVLGTGRVEVVVVDHIRVAKDHRVDRIHQGRDGSDLGTAGRVYTSDHSKTKLQGCPISTFDNNLSL